MALFDFHQLAVLYNLRLHDADFLSKHSHPPMSTLTPPHSPLTNARVHSSLPPLPPPFASPVPQTPRSRRIPATVLGLTPMPRGSSIRRKLEGDIDRVDQYDRADYEDYIREDLGCRVFVDYEVFMKRVLHVPDDWRTRWGPAIEAIKADMRFNEYHESYCSVCDDTGTLEKNFYPVLMKTANAVLGVVSRTNFKGIPSGWRQYYHISNRNHLKGGVMNKKGLSPDLVLLHRDRPRPRPGANSIHWANPLQVLEVKPYDNALCDGSTIPRLYSDGEHARRSFVFDCS